MLGAKSSTQELTAALTRCHARVRKDPWGIGLKAGCAGAGTAAAVAARAPGLTGTAAGKAGAAASAGGGSTCACAFLYSDTALNSVTSDLPALTIWRKAPGCAAAFAFAVAFALAVQCLADRKCFADAL